MTELTLTEWYPASIKPVRKGIYNVSCRSEDQSGKWYSYWNGVSFMYYGIDPRSAMKYRKEKGCGNDTKSWRGIAK
jgi:hypothetical protein